LRCTSDGGFRYQRKIRDALNPDDLGDACYMTLAEKKKSLSEF